MSYAATLEYLFAQLPMFSRLGPDAFKKDLTNIRILCERLGNPHKKFRSIHVGGTNGKGSVSHLLAAALQEAGCKTGLYTSPHLYDFRERIRVDGETVSEEFVITFTERVRPWIVEIQPSFFEITVAMAFEWFAKQDVDIAVIEVGLGGRLDSTNIIMPVLSVITNISWDHMNMLGNTLSAIAGEKAGIIKHGVPVVIGQRTAESEPVFIEQARSAGAPIHFAEDRFAVRTLQQGPRCRELDAYDRFLQRHETISLDLGGIYQEQNVATALTAIQILQEAGVEIKPEHYKAAWRQVKARTGLMGRWEVLREHPLLVLDVAHNQDGMTQLHRQLKELRYEKLHLIFGVVRDKEIDGVLALLPQADQYYFTQAHIPRALPVADLVAAAAGKGLQGAAYPDVNSALEDALLNAGAEDLILICGSIFLVAEIERARFEQAPVIS
jgi:dihydrofolate synthase/folylpolyglutamate synthase